MPTIATKEYNKAIEKLAEAKNDQEKIEALETMLKTVPKHKGTETEVARLRTQLAKLRKKSEYSF